MRGLWALAIVGLTVGCDPGEVTLLVDVRTDLVPGLEFTQTEVRVHDPSRSADRDAVLGEGFLGGVRVAELDGMPTGTRAVSVMLRDPAGDVAAERDVLVDVRASIAVTVVLTRDCRGVSCPAPAGDPALTSCLGGVCVAASCVSGGETSCEPPECTGDSDCPGDGTCGVGQCAEGVCLTRADDAMCDPTRICQPGVGCVPRPDAPDGYTQIEAGQFHTCGVLRGDAYCWGDNSFGQLGDGTRNGNTLPVPVTGLSGTVTRVSAGAEHTCAVVDGDVYCWGAGGAGQLGDDNNRDSDVPVRVMGLRDGSAVDVSAGDSFTCALAEGKAFCWGTNGIGQLGDGTSGARGSAGQVMESWTEPATIITAGQDHACALVGTTGWCWGHNDDGGALGWGMSADSLVPVPVVNVELRDLTIAGWHACGIDLAGAAWCWGRGDNGVLGDGMNMDSMVPVPVPSLASGVGQIAVGGGPMPGDMSCAEQDGVLFCWGNNQNGRLGIEPVDTPVDVPTEVMGVLGAVELSVGYWHTCARLADASTVCWGRNDFGQLGNSSIVDSTTPVTVPVPRDAG